MSVFVHAQGIKTVHAGGGGGQKKAKFCPHTEGRVASIVAHHDELLTQ